MLKRRHRSTLYIVDQLSLGVVKWRLSPPKACLSPFATRSLLDGSAVARRRNVVPRMLLRDISLLRRTIRHVANLSSKLSRAGNRLLRALTRKWCARNGNHCVCTVVIVFTRPSPAKCSSFAQQAVRNNVKRWDYDMRHGYRGPANVLWKVGETRGTVKLPIR